MIDCIYVINMKKDAERMEKFIQQVDSQFIFKRIEGVDAYSDEYKNEYINWLQQTSYPINHNTFQWKYYIHRYPDLLQAGINTKQSAWNHYKNYGKNELRSCTMNNDIVNHGQWGCLQSHINILEDAIENNYQNIIILEDDIILKNKWSNILEKLHNIMNEDKKLIYLGASQHSWENIQFTENYYFANNSTGTFAYMVHSDFFSILLNTFKQKRKPVDNYLTDIQKKYNEKCVVMFPNNIICNLENSNIGMERNNEIFFKKFKWDIYEDDTR